MVARIAPERLAQIAELLADGASHEETAAEVGVSVPTVAKYFPGTAWTKTQAGAAGLASQRARRAANL